MIISIHHVTKQKVTSQNDVTESIQKLTKHIHIFKLESTGYSAFGITFAAETNAALPRAVAGGRAHTQTPSTTIPSSLAKGQTPLQGHRLTDMYNTSASPTDTTNGRAHNNYSTTNLPHRNARAQHLDMSRCWDVANFCPLVVFVAGVRVVEFGTMRRGEGNK